VYFSISPPRPHDKASPTGSVNEIVGEGGDAKRAEKAGRRLVQVSHGGKVALVEAEL